MDRKSCDISSAKDFSPRPVRHRLPLHELMDTMVGLGRFARITWFASHARTVSPQSGLAAGGARDVLKVVHSHYEDWKDSKIKVRRK